MYDYTINKNSIAINLLAFPILDSQNDVEKKKSKREKKGY